MVSLQPELNLPRVQVHHLEARPGVLTWVTGENGAGKSMLLRQLARNHMKGGGTAYYHPQMGPPFHATVRTWFRLNVDLLPEARALIHLGDELVPRVKLEAELARLSTGEAKRLMLWSLLRAPSAYTFLDEPYEHLSPVAKARLTSILAARAATSVVVVATNQDVPAIPSTQVLDIQ